MNEKNMEIERKFLITQLPDNLEAYPHTHIEQGYLSQNPVVRVRQDGGLYYLTYKSAGLMAREEYNLPLTAEAYAHLIKKADGNIISKTRYRIPLEGTFAPEPPRTVPKAAPLCTKPAATPLCSASAAAPSCSAPAADTMQDSEVAGKQHCEYESSSGQKRPLTIELDIFEPPFAPLYLAEVEFDTIEDAERFIAPEWFGADVTNDPAYHNSVMSQLK